jgi:hypothetical protein
VQNGRARNCGRLVRTAGSVAVEASPQATNLDLDGFAMVPDGLGPRGSYRERVVFGNSALLADTRSSVMVGQGGNSETNCVS